MLISLKMTFSLTLSVVTCQLPVLAATVKIILVAYLCPIKQNHVRSHLCPIKQNHVCFISQVAQMTFTFQIKLLPV